ncbi:MAG TPA: rRNA maturation RNase YbeY [Bryobacteraceae bacterium]|nr:rRNA maturation RNase YbeY [Bryobacteraceae bacterium]
MLFRELPSHLKFSAEEKRSLKAFARTVSSRVVNRRAFTCVISNDDELHRLNRIFLGHDYPTDVLSFPEVPEGEHAGEIIISAERAEAQASQFGHGRIDEIRILMLHGLLHLAGMDHECDKGEMARAENKWRREFGLPTALIARTDGNGYGRRGATR